MIREREQASVGGFYEMIEIEKRLLTGRRILIPPARPEANPLLHILKRRGAETIEFPSLKPVPPSDFGSMDQAIEQINDYDWIVFSGSNSVVNFLKRFEALSCDISSLDGPRIAAIGHGAVSALKKEGVGVQYVPGVHTAEGVTADLGEVSGSLFLLVRVEGASRNLPQKLQDLGARVIEVVGYRMLVDATEEMAGIAFGQRLDALALANPSAVRFLLKGAEQAGLNLVNALDGVTIAAVGPATAKEAKQQGITPDIVSEGHIADLANSLTHFFADH